MKVYLAAKFTRQAEMREVRESLVAMGHEVTSHWLDLNHDGSDDADHWATESVMDVKDVAAADTVISFTGGAPSVGRHMEYGMAVAWGKLRVIVGPVEGVFHKLPQTIRFDNTAAMLDWAKVSC